MRFLKICIFLVSLLLPRLSAGQEAGMVSAITSAGQKADTILAVPSDGQETDSVLMVMFTGDIMGHDGQISSAYDDSTGTYSYDSVFKYVSPLLLSLIHI